MEKIIRLKPILEDTSYYDKIEKRIKELFKKEFYYPLLNLLDVEKKIINSVDDNLKKAIMSGKIYYSNGKFHGKFTSSISKQLVKYGAEWNKKDSTYSIKIEDLPMDIRSSISLSQRRYDERLNGIDKKLSNFDINSMLSKLNIAPIFDENINKVDKTFEESIKSITVVPRLSKNQRSRIAQEWQNNLELYIKNFADEQTRDLRKKVQDNVFVKGNRRESLIKGFMESYNVTENKAKFWARQETNLLMAKYKETKYTEAGVNEYEWRCVHMPHQPSPNAIYKAGEVRYSHGILEGKIFSWKDPPVTTPPGQSQRRNNPGQDYNCRCFALPIVRFKK